MKNKPHMHRIGMFNIWHTKSGWMAAPISSGQCREAAVMIPSRKGAVGSKVHRDSDGVLAVTHPSFTCSYSRVIRTNVTRKAAARLEAAIYAAYRQTAYSIALQWNGDELCVVRWSPSDSQWILVESTSQPQKGGR